MKGLITKDLYCLRKSIKLLLGVTAGIIILSVLFVISTRCGNLADAIKVTEAENPDETGMVLAMFEVGVWVSLAVPLAFIANITDCFKEDHRADFHKFLFTMPLKYQVIVGSRYITCLIYVLVSYAGSMLAAFFVSLASDTYKFSELAGIISMVAAVFIVYVAVVLVLVYVFGSSHTDLLQCVPFVLVAVILYAVFVKKLFAMDDAGLDAITADMGNILQKVKDFIMGKGIICLLLSLLILGLSYMVSVAVMEHKKGRKL